jgi:hypothetical protein
LLLYCGGQQKPAKIKAEIEKAMQIKSSGTAHTI